MIQDRRALLQASVGAAALGALGASRAVAQPANASVATTRYGKISGRRLGAVMGFLGIPYGGPADGAGRFRPPGPVAPWQGVRPAVKGGPRAVQTPSVIYTDELLGPYFSGGRSSDAAELTVEDRSENCLVLNVLTPGLTGRRPVMVYLHGGGFTQGAGSLTTLSDRFVAEEDVVLVGINHRLNVFGYTYLGHLDPDLADFGNVGQLDLIAALTWVRDNIAGFGGDPGNVTIFGEFGGGGKVSTLLAMPQAKGLFRRAIVESGSMLRARTRDAAIADTTKLLAAIGLTPDRVGELRTMPADKLFAAASTGGQFGFGPVVDGRSLPHQTWEDGAPPEAAGVSMIIGNCEDESTLFSLRDQSLYTLDWTSLRAELVKRGVPDGKVDAIIAACRQDHPADTASDAYFRLSTARGARRNATTQAERKLSQGKGDVFVYSFDWRTPLMDGKLRAFHTAELPLAMRLVRYPEADALSRQIAGAWAAFARTGDPNHPGLPHWPRYALAERPTMAFDVGNTRVVNAPDQAEVDLLRPYPGGLL